MTRDWKLCPILSPRTGLRNEWLRAHWRWCSIGFISFYHRILYIPNKFIADYVKERARKNNICHYKRDWFEFTSNIWRQLVVRNILISYGSYNLTLTDTNRVKARQLIHRRYPWCCSTYIVTWLNWLLTPPLGSGSTRASNQWRLTRKEALSLADDARATQTNHNLISSLSTTGSAPLQNSHLYNEILFRWYAKLLFYNENTTQIHRTNTISFTPRTLGDSNAHRHWS